MTKKILGLLLKKNLLVELRSYVQTLIEIFAIFIIFVIILQTKDYKKFKKSHYQKDVDLNDLSHFKKLMSNKGANIPLKLYYTPKTNYNHKIFKIIADNLKLSEAVGFNNENDMIEHFNATSTLAAVILQDNTITLRFPNNFRTGPNKKFLATQDFWLTRCNRVVVDYYIREGYLQLLLSILRTRVKEESGKEISVRTSSVYSGLQTNEGCVSDLNPKYIGPQTFFKWSLYNFMYILPFLNLIWKLAREYEEVIFVHHSIYGVTFESQRLAHFVVSLLHLIVLDTVVFVLITLFWPSLPAWKYFILFLFLILYNMLLFFYAMILASFMRDSKTAVWLGLLIWITSYAVFLGILNTMRFDISKKTFFIISLFFFNNLFANGLMDYFEEETCNCVKEIWLFLGLQFVILLIYGCLFRYVEYSILKNYRKTGSKECKRQCWEWKCKPNDNYIEYGPLTGEVLRLKNVSSCCDDDMKKPQLKNISLRIFENEISVLLGPHSSGKTDLIKILAGWLPVHGSIISQGRNIVQDSSYYNQHMAIALSNNPLFDLLTIRETLKYFIILKQADEIDLTAELIKWQKILKPLMNCDRLVKALDYGEKRILTLCCAMVCNTRVILLDEPTAHMKSVEQSNFWRILKLEKKNRSIIVATSSVDEATEIAGRVGILHDGCLVAWGTSYFLRTKCANLFYLVCLIGATKPIEPITAILGKYVQNFKLYSHFTDRVIYTLPADKKSSFQRLLLDLETHVVELGISNIYITGSSLNEVYMNLTKSAEVKIPDIGNTLKFLQEKQNKENGKYARALLYKKLFCQSKDFLPICIIFVAVFLMLTISRMPPAYLNLDSLTFSGREVFRSANYSFLEIHNVANIEKGLFYYENVKYLNDDQTWRNYNGMAGLDVKERNVWFNAQMFHSAPLALNLAFNYLNNASVYINKPIILWKNYDVHLLLGMVMPLTNSLVFVRLQEERYSHMWTLENIAGVNSKTQWMMTFLWDLPISFLTSELYLVIVLTCVVNGTHWLMAMAASILFLLNGVASLFFIYLMFLFIMEANKLKAYIKIFFIQLNLGLIPFVFYVHILEAYADMLFYAFMILPGFSVLHATTKIFNNNEKLNFSSYFQWDNPGVLDSIVFITLAAVINIIIFVAVLVYRRAYLKSVPEKVKNLASVCYPYDDQRVVKEKVRISNMNINSCRAQAVLVDQLENRLPKTGNIVDSISFALNNNTCLGIYGSNHSGKSHLLKQLVGEEGYWFGEVYISGFNSKTQMANALENIGYCPQNKGFNGLLTPTELFTVFLMMYGIDKSDQLNCLRHFSMSFQLRKYMRCRVKDLPANIQRRINVAVALIGRKRVFIFDEPTRGLPAFDRLLIWNTIKHLRSQGKTIIFSTSDSMELKELADLVVTVNEGEMLSYNNPHRMEYQHNFGFYLEVKLYADGLTLEEVIDNLSNDVENLNRFVMFLHEESELLYRCDTVCHYFIPVENIIYSYIFGTIEKQRKRLNIADYTLAPFSLNGVLKLLQKSRKNKIRPERARTTLLKDPKALPRRYS